MNRWKPKIGETYYYLTIDPAGRYSVSNRKHEDWLIDLLHVDCGNCFQTENDAWPWVNKLNLAVEPILRMLDK